MEPERERSEAVGERAPERERSSPSDGIDTRTARREREHRVPKGEWL